MMDTPPSVVERGNARDGLELGPILWPNIVKIEPRAIDPAGRPGDMKLAAFTIPRGETIGWANPTIEGMERSKTSLRILSSRLTQFTTGIMSMMTRQSVEMPVDTC